MKLLIVGLAREFSAEERATLAEHLTGCGPCRAARGRLLWARPADGGVTGMDTAELKRLLEEARTRSGVRVVPAEGLGAQAGEVQTAVGPEGGETDVPQRPAAHTAQAASDEVGIPHTETGPQAEAAEAHVPGYEIIDVIGSGAMGTVYKARQVSMDRIVALKVLSPELAADGEFTERFLREARASGRLNHQNVVGVFDSGRYSLSYYIAMEYVDGRPARDMLESVGRFPERQAIGICLEMARALEHASRYGLIHRDVKPDNILVGSSGVAKLCDLGLSKAVRGGADITQDGVVVGTPFYISPEQARGSLDLDVRTDIYSLGCTLYHMLTGRVPFEGKTPAVVMKQHLKDPFPNPRRIVPDISSGLVAILHRMVEKDRANRYSSARELREDIEAFVEGRFRGRPPAYLAPARMRALVRPGRPRREGSARRRTTVHLKRIRGPRMLRRSRGGVLTIAVMLLCVAGAAALFALTQKRKAADVPAEERGAFEDDEGRPSAAPVRFTPSAVMDPGLASVDATVERLRRRFREDPSGAESHLRELNKATMGVCDAGLQQQADALRTEIVVLLENEANGFLAEARAKAQKLTEQERFGEALQDGGPLDVKLAPPRAKRRLAAIRADVYAKADAVLQQRIKESADPAAEFRLLTRGMPGSLVERAAGSLGIGVEGERRK